MATKVLTVNLVAAPQAPQQAPAGGGQPPYQPPATIPFVPPPPLSSAAAAALAASVAGQGMPPLGTANPQAGWQSAPGGVPLFPPAPPVVPPLALPQAPPPPPPPPGGSSNPQAGWQSQPGGVPLPPGWANPQATPVNVPNLGAPWWQTAGRAAPLAAGLGLGNVASALGGVAQVGAGVAQGNPFLAAGGMIQVAQALKEITLIPFKAAKEAVEGFSRSVVEISGNRYFGTFKRGLDAVEGTLKKIPIVGEIAAAGLGVLNSAIQGVYDTAQAFIKRGEELAQYSGELAEAQSRKELRGLEADIREADRLGPELARLTEAEDEAWHKFREFMEPLKKVIISALADILENLTTAMSNAKDVAINGLEIMGGIQAAIGRVGGGVGQFFGMQAAANQNVLAALRRPEEEGNDKDANERFDAFLRVAPRVFVNPGAFPQGGDAGERNRRNAREMIDDMRRQGMDDAGIRFVEALVGR